LTGNSKQFIIDFVNFLRDLLAHQERVTGGVILQIREIFVLKKASKDGIMAFL